MLDMAAAPAAGPSAFITTPQPFIDDSPGVRLQQPEMLLQKLTHDGGGYWHDPAVHHVG